MATSQVLICNRALLRIGGQAITNIDDDTPEAKRCKILFDSIVDEVSVTGSWSTTIRRQALNLTTNTPAFGFTSEFQLPVDPFCLKVLSINDHDIVPTGFDASFDFHSGFRVEGDKLLSNITAIKIKYIGRLTDPNKFGPYLTNAIVSRLAAELGYELTGKEGVVRLLWEQYYRDLNDHLSRDTQQGSAQITHNTQYHQVR